MLNTPEKAFALARQKRAPLFVHFFGIWCPPCNMLEEAVYPTPEFQRAAAPFVKLALDADAQLSWELKGRFKIGGYPTLLVLDEQGREVSRAVGYRSPAALKAFLSRSRSLLKRPIEDVSRSLDKAAPDADGAARARVADWRLARGEYELALSAAGSAPESRREALLARKQKAEKEDDSPALLAVLKELTTDLPEDPELTEWAATLAELDKPAAEALVEAVRAGASRWTADPSLSEYGLVAGDILATQAYYLETLGRNADAQAAWFSAALAYDSEVSASRLTLARGANLERAYCLQKAGRLDEARALYEELVAAYPGEFTFHYGYGRLLLELKNYSAALDSARSAVKSGYGDNWLRAVALEAKILKALDRKPEMIRALDGALAEASAPKSTAVRTHRYLAELRRLRSEL
ncbi:MAG: tetratricopeptide repeat protein [Elusimicrobiota bacterium]